MGIPFSHPAIQQAIERGLIQLGNAPQAPALEAELPDGISEREFQQKVIGLAERHGWRVYHTFDSRRSAPGWPDLSIARPGQLILAELKTDAGKLRPEQAEWLELLRTVEGIRVRLWRPSLWPAIVAELTQPE